MDSESFQDWVLDEVGTYQRIHGLQVVSHAAEVTAINGFAEYLMQRYALEMQQAAELRHT